MMKRGGGGFQWSKLHNSEFENEQLNLVDFTRSNTVKTPPLVLWGVAILPQPLQRFIRVIVDEALQWNCQADHIVAKAVKWITAFGHLA
jgi:hypothetical protein